MRLEYGSATHPCSLAINSDFSPEGCEAFPCAARRRSKLPCRGPAMRGRPVCRLHGGKGGGPMGDRNGAYRTGRYTAEAEAERQAARALLKELRRLIDAGNEGFGGSN